MESVDTLFSTSYKVTLAPKAKCSFLALGNTQLTWEPQYESETAVVPNTKPVWTYVLNYTINKLADGRCQLYGGDTLEEAARNVTPGRWLKTDFNCAYYVVVGNNMRVGNAVFTFSRTAAEWLRSSIAQIIGVLGISMIMLI